MTVLSHENIVKQLLADRGRTYANEIGIKVEQNTPAPLFQLLCASILFSARISADIAVAATRALIDSGWTTADNMAASSWEDRARVLNEAGYARYDERTSSMLGDTAQTVIERYSGDLRNLREESDRKPDAERERLKTMKGIGDTGVDIFFREVQVAWDEIYPFADDRALKSAGAMDLPQKPKALADLVSRKDFPRLVAALVRVHLDGAHDEVLEAAREQ